MEITSITGTMATVGSLSVASIGILSQVRANYKNKKCGINLLYATLILISYTLWTVYAITKKDVFIFIPHFVGMSLATIILFQHRLYSKKQINL